MNRNVSLPVATAIIAFALCLIGLGLWFHARMISVPSPGLMQPTDWNTGLIRVQSLVLEVDAQGEVIRRIDLNDYNATDSSDVALLSPSEVLIYRDTRPDSLWENLQSFLRLEQTIDTGTESELGLYRCHLDTKTCQPFTKLWDNPGRLLRFAVHPSGHIAISDTTHHRIYLFDGQGRLQHRLNKGLRFPNQITWDNDRLWVANTNIHRLDSFTQQGLSPSQSSPELKAGSQHRFPTAFAQLENDWWVLVKNPSLSQGRLLVFDREWNPKGDMALPEGSDAVSLLTLGSQLYISDIKGLRISRLNPADGGSEEFLPPEFTELLTEARHDQRVYRIAMWSTIGVFSVFLIGGLGLGLYLEKRHAQSIPPETEGMTIEQIARLMPLGHPKEYWIPKDPKKVKLLRQVPYAAGALILVLIMMLLFMPEGWKEAPMMLTVIVIAIAPSVLMRRYWDQTDLGI